jgi:gamma-glutamyltranspeptidase/glutathione hydrolase
MTLAQILEPVIRLAEEGWEMSSNVHENTRLMLSDLRQYAGREFASIYLDELGLPLKIGTIVKNPNYAKTLRLIAERGPEAIYTGDVAETIVRLVQTYGGVMTMSDLRKVMEEQPRLLEPARTTYKGYEILSGPPTGFINCEVLNLMEAAEISRYAPYSTEWCNLFLECVNLAKADRQAYIGDPSFTTMPTEGLLNKDYAKSQVARIVPGKMQAYTPGDPWAFQEGKGEPVASKGPESKHTTHLSVADKDGNMVSITQTLMGDWGSKIFIEGYGFMLNSSMMNFSLDPTVPNSVGGNKKPHTNMTPSVVNRPDGKPFLSIGVPGASTIYQKIPHIIANMIDTGKTAGEVQLMPIVTWSMMGKPTVEYYSDMTNTGLDVIPDNVLKALEGIGYTLEASTYESWMNIIEFREDGTLWAEPDPRYVGRGLAF